MMCARFIVDRNAFFVVMPRQSRRERDLRFLEWYKNGHGRLCYAEETYPEKETRSREKTYAEENADQMELLEEYRAKGDALVAAGHQMREASAWLDMSGFKICSNDRHMLVLSLATEATILCTRDGSLRKDFRNLNIDGKVRKIYPVSPQNPPPETKERFKQEQREFLARNRCEKAPPVDPIGA